MGIPKAMQFGTLAANGDSSSVQWPGGRGVFTAYGTFGGGTATLQWSPDDGTTWIAVDRSGDTFCTLSATGDGGFELGKCQLRVHLTGATSPSITAGVQSTNKGV